MHPKPENNLYLFLLYTTGLSLARTVFGSPECFRCVRIHTRPDVLLNVFVPVYNAPTLVELPTALPPLTRILISLGVLIRRRTVLPEGSRQLSGHLYCKRSDLPLELFYEHLQGEDQVLIVHLDSEEGGAGGSKQTMYRGWEKRIEPLISRAAASNCDYSQYKLCMFNISCTWVFGLLPCFEWDEELGTGSLGVRSITMMRLRKRSRN